MNNAIETARLLDYLAENAKDGKLCEFIRNENFGEKITFATDGTEEYFYFTGQSRDEATIVGKIIYLHGRLTGAYDE